MTPVAAPEVEVVVARAPLDAEALLPFRQLLAEDERARADNYRSEEARAVFTLTRGLLRRELGRRLGIASARVTFKTLPSGKPLVRLEGSPAAPAAFNVSHSGPYLAIALAHVGGIEVGVDIEQADRSMRPLEIARRYFHPSELRALESLPEAEQKSAFLAVWTRKEAVVKARGSTMAESLTTLEVDCDPEAEHPEVRDDVEGRAPCAVTTLSLPGLPLVGALAVTGVIPGNVILSVRSAPTFD